MALSPVCFSPVSANPSPELDSQKTEREALILKINRLLKFISVQDDSFICAFLRATKVELLGRAELSAAVLRRYNTIFIFLVNEHGNLALRVKYAALVHFFTDRHPFPLPYLLPCSFSAWDWKRHFELEEPEYTVTVPQVLALAPLNSDFNKPQFFPLHVPKWLTLATLYSIISKKILPSTQQPYFSFVFENSAIASLFAKDTLSNPPTPSSRLVMVSKIVKGTQNLPWEAQEATFNHFGPLMRPPSLLEALTALFCLYLKFGIRLYSTINGAGCMTHCQHPPSGQRFQVGFISKREIFVGSVSGGKSPQVGMAAFVDAEPLLGLSS